MTTEQLTEITKRSLARDGKKATPEEIERAVADALSKYPDPDNPWMNTPQAAAYTKFSEEYLEIARHRDDGTGPPYYKHPRAVRYHRDDLDRWMTSFRKADPSPLKPRRQREVA
jgi:hypothetical protein